MVSVIFFAGGVWYQLSHKKEKQVGPIPKISFQSDEQNEIPSTETQIPPKQNSEHSDGIESSKNEFTPATIELGGKDRPLSEEEMDNLEAYYERSEKEWSQKVSNIFDEFGLPKSAYGEYEKLREAYEEAKMDAFQEFHNKMIEKYGENYEYNPSDEQENFDNKVNTQYQEKLKRLLGAGNYPKYVEMRDQYNDKLTKEQNPELGKMLMDF